MTYIYISIYNGGRCHSHLGSKGLLQVVHIKYFLKDKDALNLARF